MNPFADDELASAYLDGELAPDDRARFEQQLAERPELRQLVEELRGLRASFEGLPRYRLEPDFAERVLRRAEREMLSARQAVDGAREAGGSTPAAARLSAAVERATPARSGGLSWSRLARPLGYVAVALAAAVAVMVFNPDARRDELARDVAFNERGAAEALPGPAAPAGADTDRGGAMRSAVEVAPADEAAPLAKLGMAPEQPETRGLSRETLTLPTEPMGKLGPAAVADMPAVELKRQDAAAAAGGDVLAVIDDPELLVVQLQITPEAARDDFFRRLLLRNQIDASEVAEAPPADAREGGSRVEPSLAEAEAVAPAAGKPPAEEFRQERLQGAARAAADPTAIDAYVVVCPPEQLAATLVDLQAHRGEVAQVAIVPPGPARQQLRRGTENDRPQLDAVQLAELQRTEAESLRQLYVETAPRAGQAAAPNEAYFAEGLGYAVPPAPTALAPESVSKGITPAPLSAATAAGASAPALPPVLAGPQSAPAGPPLATGAAVPERLAGGSAMPVLERSNGAAIIAGGGVAGGFGTAPTGPTNLSLPSYGLQNTGPVAPNAADTSRLMAVQNRFLGESRGRAVRYVLPGQAAPPVEVGATVVTSPAAAARPATTPATAAPAVPQPSASLADQPGRAKSLDDAGVAPAAGQPAPAAPSSTVGRAMENNYLFAPAQVPVAGEKVLPQRAYPPGYRRAVFFVQVVPGGSPAAASAPTAPTSPAAAPGSTVPSTPAATPPAKPSAPAPSP